jgi:hypothetical protein
VRRKKGGGTVNDYPGFGLCPKCYSADGYINVGCEQWFYCVEHQTKWCAGDNLLSSWLDETPEEQARQYAELKFGNFRNVKPRTLVPVGTANGGGS